VLEKILGAGGENMLGTLSNLKKGKKKRGVK